MTNSRTASTNNQGFSVQDLILIAVLLAAGAVLKLTVSSFLQFGGMKPNFMIAMYALAIILTKPKVWQAVIIGLITGLVSQLPMLSTVPWVNVASETVGALVCGILVAFLSRFLSGKALAQGFLFPAIIAFFTTAFSGYTFALIVGCVLNGLELPAVIVMYAVMVLGTATMNCILVGILTTPMRKVLKLENRKIAQPSLKAEDVKPQTGFTIQNLILIALLLAAGAVLKLTVSSFLQFGGMKPNFMIAMYALAIILTKPKVWQALVIGLITGLVSQLPMLSTVPWVNLASETLGALTCGILVALFAKLLSDKILAQGVLFPAITAFLTTTVSGYTFAIIVGCVLNGLDLPAVLVMYAVMVLGTASMNCILVGILVAPLRAVLKYDQTSVVEETITNRTFEKIEGPHGMIEVMDVSFTYAGNKKETLHDINLSIEAGSFIGVTGAAGSGKSTLTYLFNGIVPHCYPGTLNGKVYLDGIDTTTMNITDVSGLVGSVCQDIDSQMVASIVEDEILYGLENFGVPKDEIESRITESLEAMGISELRDRQIGSLSGGQKQKVAVAAILALKPKVLILDEPTAELDPASSLNVFNLLKSYAKDHGTTVIVVEQKIALLSDFADKLIIVNEGTVRFFDTPEAVLENSEELIQIGVSCPRSTSLVNELRKVGLYQGGSCCTVPQAVAACKEVLA